MFDNTLHCTVKVGWEGTYKPSAELLDLSNGHLESLEKYFGWSFRIGKTKPSEMDSNGLNGKNRLQGCGFVQPEITFAKIMRCIEHGRNRSENTAALFKKPGIEVARRANIAPIPA